MKKSNHMLLTRAIPITYGQKKAQQRNTDQKKVMVAVIISEKQTLRQKKKNIIQDK